MLVLSDAIITAYSVGLVMWCRPLEVENFEAPGYCGQLKMSTL